MGDQSLININTDDIEAHSDIIIDIDNSEKNKLLKEKVLDMVIEDFKREIFIIIRSKRRLYIVTNWTEYLAQISIFLSAIVAFVGGFYKIEILTIVAGCLSVLSISLMKLSSYADREMHERANSLVKSMNTIGISTNVLPQIVIENT